MKKRDIVNIIAISFILALFFSCSKKREISLTKNTNSPAFKNAVKCIQNAKYMEDIFQKDTISIKIPPDYPIAYIDDIHVTEEKRVLILDSRQRIVLYFDSTGRFIRKIGGEGHGPGEFITPKYVLTNSKDEIIVADDSQFRISFFDRNGNFLHSFRTLHHGIWGMLISPQDNVIIHDYDKAKWLGVESIYVYNEKGKLLKKFGHASQANIKLKNLPVGPEGPYLALYSNYIFETDYPDYHIRKYDVQGHFIKEFGVKPKHWRSLLKSNYRSLPTPKMVTPAIMKKLDSYFAEFEKYSIIWWIKAFDPGIICVMIKAGKGGFGKSAYFSFYDTNGNLIANGLKFRNYPKWNKLPRTYLAPLMPKGLCFVKFLTDITKEPVKGKNAGVKVNIIALRLKTKGE